EEDTRQPTMRLANTSMMKATYAKPCQVLTKVKSDTHRALGRSALNCRLTRSSGQGKAGSLTVVLMDFPRMAPCNPIRLISRSTVQRATSIDSRVSCFQTLRAP